MLHARYRLRNRHAFPKIYQRGKRQGGSLCGLSWLPIPAQSDQTPQVAVVVSRKVCRKAVGRNRIKRQLRAALQPLLPQIRFGYWLILTARSGIVGRSWSEIRDEVERLVRKAKLLDPSAPLDRHHPTPSAPKR